MPIQSKKKDFSHQDNHRDEQLLQVIRELRQDINESLQQEEARRLNASLGQHLSRAKQPELRKQAILKAVERIDEYPVVRERFSENLDRAVKWYSHPHGRDIFSIAGDLFDIDPGELMVCPCDPHHYQRYRRHAQQKLYCPHHAVELKSTNEMDGLSA